MVTTVEYDLGRLPAGMSLTPTVHHQCVVMISLSFPFVSCSLYNIDVVPIVIVRGETPKETYASQWYQDGTKCDVTNRPRTYCLALTIAIAINVYPSAMSDSSSHM
jgi:hypothetical protein